MPDGDSVVPETNDAWLFGVKGVKTLGLEKRDVPQTCGPWEAVVCPKRTGLCGSDMHIFHNGMVKGKPMEKPFILGHESSGIVVLVGENVTDIKPGDRVALEPGEGCLRCDYCKSGHYAQCPNMKFAAAGGLDGTLQGFYKLPADLCYKLPDNMTLEEGALIEPLAVGVNAVSNVAKIHPGSNVVVCGAGPVGLLTMACAKAFGARRLIAIDVNEERLAYVKDYLGAETHLSVPMESGEDTSTYSVRHAALISEKFGLTERGQAGIDCVLECSGAEVCIQTGLLLLKRRGVIALIGNPRPNVTLPLSIVGFRELQIKGCFRYGPGVYRLAIDLVQRGLISLKPLITHIYPFREAPEAFDTTAKAKGPDGKMAIKVMRRMLGTMPSPEPVPIHKTPGNRNIFINACELYCPPQGL